MAGHRRNRVALLLTAAAVLGAGLVAWKQSQQPAPNIVVPPEIPSNIHDSEIVAAIERARNAVLSKPQSGQAWGELGMVLLAHRFEHQSNICFEEALGLDPDNPRWPYLIGFNRMQEGSKPAIPYLRSAYNLAKEREHKSATRLRLAEVCLDSGELIEAGKLFEEEVSADPQNLRARHGQAVLAIHRGDYRAAIAFLNQTLNPGAHHQSAAILATCHRQLGEIEKAERFERESASVMDGAWPDPFVAEFTQRQTGYISRLRLAGDLQTQGRWLEAAVIIEELVRTNPDDHTLVLLGYNLIQLRQFHRAEEVLRGALARNSNNSMAHLDLGLALSLRAEEQLKAGDRPTVNRLLEAAVIEFRQAAKLNPMEGQAHRYAGLALKNLGMPSQAVDEYRAALLVTPEHAASHLELGELLMEMNKPNEAIPVLEESIRLGNPNEKAKKLLERAKAKLP
jgi:tetratricopeptide (TPR) repeat protein